jgi:hypothetical protein
MAPTIPVTFLLSRKFPKRIGLGKEHPTVKEIKEISWRQPKKGQSKGFSLLACRKQCKITDSQTAVKKGVAGEHHKTNRAGCIHIVSQSSDAFCSSIR